MDADKLRLLIEDQLRLSRKLKARIAELESQTTAPLAVVGMSMRLPGGVQTPRQYWDFLLADHTAIAGIPEDRPGLRAIYDPDQDKPGKSYVDRAAFLDDIASFDPAFFGISVREAESMDPQQRLLLETAWEALERAGIAVRRHERLPVGVFVGIMASEYNQRLADPHDLTKVDPYYSTGGGHCFAAGRVSYTMGFSGPALSVDTACSSSLAALHLASQSLRRGECEYALVGGANLILGPDLMVSLCQSQALSPRGQSRAFLAGADGYGRGEGVGFLALMRLADAEAQHRPILAVVRGTATNHDGASSGLTVPSGPAQQEVVRAALADARIAPADVGYVEAHGTGTSLGDPIEVGALDQVIGTGAGERVAPVAIGSVKSRIGHLEAAAGIAGVLKVVLMLRAGVIPAAVTDPKAELNPLIPWDQVALTVPTQTTPWPKALPARVAGISAFGLSGTNAHAVLSAYEPAAERERAVAGRRELLTLSARTPAALANLVEHTRDLLGRTDATDLSSVCHTMRAGRVHFPHRLAVTGATSTELVAELSTVLAQPPQLTPPDSNRLNLRIAVDDDVLDGAVTAIAEEYPLLATAIAQAEDPTARLVALLNTLDIRVRVLSEPAAHDEGGHPIVRLEFGGQTLPLATDDAAEAPGLLLDALSTLYFCGVELRLDALAAPGVSYLDDVPTYPFDHKRYWIDEIVTTGATPARAEPVPQPAAATPLHDRKQLDRFLFTELGSVLKAETALDPAVPFVEIGGDSFTAMLLTKSIEKQYGVELPPDEIPIELPVGELVGWLGPQILAAVGDVRDQESAS